MRRKVGDNFFKRGPDGCGLETGAWADALGEEIVQNGGDLEATPLDMFGHYVIRVSLSVPRLKPLWTPAQQCSQIGLLLEISHIRRRLPRAVHRALAAADQTPGQ